MTYQFLEIEREMGKEDEIRLSAKETQYEMKEGFIRQSTEKSNVRGTCDNKKIRITRSISNTKKRDFPDL